MQLTFREIEEAFEIGEKTLYHWLSGLEMPAAKANDQYYFNSVEVLEWALKKRIPLTPGALKLCEKSRAGRDILVPALSRGGVYPAISASHPEDALNKALDILPLPEHIQRQQLKDILISREQAGTTCIGAGIAIPHVKHPIVLAGTDPVTGLFFLDPSLDFRAPDGEKVHTLFLILTSSFKGHLALLSRLAFCLQDDTVKAALGRRGREEILAAFQVAESKAAR